MTNLKNDTFYLLNLIDNYHDELYCNEMDVINDFSSIIIDYVKYANVAIKQIAMNNNSFSKFLLVRGIDTIFHVFETLLYYTKNPKLVLHNCQKSFYFYIEFVSQITQDDKSFLQLTSVDAVLYVYKKTIFEIIYEKKCSKTKLSNESREKIEKINCILDVIKSLMYKIIYDENYNANAVSYMNTYSNIISVILYGNSHFLDKNVKKMCDIIKILIVKITNIDVLFKCLKNFLKTTNNDISLFDNKSQDDIITGFLVKY